MLHLQQSLDLNLKVTYYHRLIQINRHHPPLLIFQILQDVVILTKNFKNFYII